MLGLAGPSADLIAECAALDQEGAQRSGVRVPLPRSEVDSPLGGTDVVSVGRGLRLDGRRQVC